MQARVLFSAYRRDNFADPEGFIIQLGVVLEQYSEEVIRRVTDPRTGLQRTCKFPPTIAEVVEACDVERERLHKIVEAARSPRPQFNRPYVPPPNYPGCRANLFVHAAAPQYGAIKAWSESPAADSLDWRLDERGRAGIWIALSVWQNMSAGRLTVGRQVGSIITDAELRAHYGRQERDAV